MLFQSQICRHVNSVMIVRLVYQPHSGSPLWVDAAFPVSYPADPQIDTTRDTTCAEIGVGMTEMKACSYSDVGLVQLYI